MASAYTTELTREQYELLAELLHTRGGFTVIFDRPQTLSINLPL